MGITEGESPDIFATSKVSCFCGNLTLAPPTHPPFVSAQVSMTTQCMNCGCVIEQMMQEP